MATIIINKKPGKDNSCEVEIKCGVTVNLTAAEIAKITAGRNGDSYKTATKCKYNITEAEERNLAIWLLENLK